MKRLADALGAVRDQDVAILALEQLQSAAEIDRTSESRLKKESKSCSKNAAASVKERKRI